VGALVWSLATLLTAITRNFDELLLRHTASRSHFVILPHFVADMFPRKACRVMGIFLPRDSRGSALGYLIGGVVARNTVWRFPFYVGAARECPGAPVAVHSGAAARPVSTMPHTARLSETP